MDEEQKVESAPEQSVAAPKKLPWYEDPERRQAHLDKLEAGRAARRARLEATPPPKDYQYANDEPNYPLLMRMLREIRWDRMELSMADGLMGCLDSARMEGLGRIRQWRERETANRCSYCGDLFPNGRHFEQLVWTDTDTQGLVSRLSCAKLVCRSQMREEHDRERRRRLG